MGQISLPDTAVIDISVIQTMVNAINRLDSQVSELFETFVDIGYEDSDDGATDLKSGYNPTVHQIQFGKVKVESTEFISKTAGGATYYVAVKNNIPYNIPFKTDTKPVIVFSASHVIDDDEMSVSLVLNSNSQFTARIKATEDSDMWIHWIAIGTRS